MTTASDHESQLSATSVKNYAETAKILDKLARRWWHDFVDLFDQEGRETSKVIKSDIVHLRSDSGQFRAILNRIAEGDVKREHTEALAEKLRDTASDVYAALFRLTKEHREFLDDRFGVGFWNRFDTQVREMKMHIRERISKLGNKRGTREAKQKAASEILDDIELFNNNLAQICDVIVPPKR